MWDANAKDGKEEPWREYICWKSTYDDLPFHNTSLASRILEYTVGVMSWMHSKTINN